MAAASVPVTVRYCVCLDWDRAADADLHTMNMILPTTVLDDSSEVMARSPASQQQAGCSSTVISRTSSTDDSCWSSVITPPSGPLPSWKSISTGKITFAGNDVCHPYYDVGRVISIRSSAD
eukprot:209148-Prorocentrum_minimum.AAC.1